MTSEEGKVVPPDRPATRESYFRVGAVDRALAVMDSTSAVEFEATVELEGPVDHQALAEGWRRLASRHPILSCIRVGDRWQPSAMPPVGPGVEQPRHETPPVALRVVDLEDGVRLSMLCNHVAFDGIASVTLLADLREEYNGALERRSERDPDWSARTLEAVVGTGVDWRKMTAAVLRGASAWWQSPPSTHFDPTSPLTTTPSTGHLLMEFGPILEALGPLRRKYRWSTDAVLVGVLEKAWSTVFGAPSAESTWLVAQDLRPALGAARGVGNLSVTAGVSIEEPRADLLSVIDRVDSGIKAQAGDLIAAAAAASRWGFAANPVFSGMLRRSLRRRHYRSVSNVGQLGDSLDRWGSASLSRIWFVGPLADSPFTSFIAAGHGSSTLVSVRTSPHWLTDEHAIALERAALEMV